MAKDRSPVRAEAKGTIRVSGRFFPAGAGAPTVTTSTNVGWTVARTGTGQFTVTFGEKYAQLVSLGAVTVQLAALADTDAQWGTFTAATATTFATVVITAKTAGAAADIAANANNSINFDITFSEQARL